MIHEEVVKWKINLFQIGKGYTDEYTRVIHKWVKNNQLQKAAVKLIMIMLPLLFQKSR